MLNILKSIFCLAVFLWSSDKDCIYLVQSMATNVKLNFCLEKVIFLKILRRKATVTEMILLKQISLALAWVWSKYHLAIAEAEFKVKIGNIKFGLMVTMNSFRNYVGNNSSKLWRDLGKITWYLKQPLPIFSLFLLPHDLLLKNWLPKMLLFSC